MIGLSGGSQILRSDEELILLRPGPVQFVDGKPVQSQPQQIKFIANVQPVDGRDLLLVPEADRYKEQFDIFTEHCLRVNDQILRQGIRFQVQNAQGWGRHFECRIMRIDVGPNANP